MNFQTVAIDINGKEFDNSENVYKGIYEILTNPDYEIKDVLYYKKSVCYNYLADVWCFNKNIIGRHQKKYIIAYIEQKLIKQLKICFKTH